MIWPFGAKPRASEADGEAVGLFLFCEVSEAIKAETVLKSRGYEAQLVAPPFRLRRGCGLAVALPRVECVGAERTLHEADVEPREWVDDAEGTAEVCDRSATVDFGQWLMVRAGNCKVVIEKTSGAIVNTSGGGCPDAPYLDRELAGMRIDDAPRPKEIGYTLCGLMLDRACAEARAHADGTDAA